MKNLDLVKPTNVLLNEVAGEVAPLDIPSKSVQDVIVRMISLSAGKGKSEKDTRQMVGLAAVQLGVGKRIITIDLTADGNNKKQNLQVIINPRITAKSDERIDGREGCWSCGNICGIVERAEKITVAGFDQTGSPIELHLTDFVARIAQHEVDHLDGIRFPDRIPAGQPDRLHMVKPEEFEAYRKNWMNWNIVCPREVWEKMKAGV